MSFVVEVCDRKEKDVTLKKLEKIQRVEIISSQKAFLRQLNNDL